MLQCGAAALDLNRRSVALGRSVVMLSPLECRALEALFASCGRIVSGDALLKAIWPEGSCKAMNLRALIGRLRQKLGSGCIETIGREGYRWVGREGAIPGSASSSRRY